MNITNISQANCKDSVSTLNFTNDQLNAYNGLIEFINSPYEENDYKNPHKGRGIWIIAEEKETKVQHRFKSMRSCEKFTGVDRHRIKHFLKGERNNWTKFNFYYDE